MSAVPASPTRSSARLRGVKIDVDLNALDAVIRFFRIFSTRSSIMDLII